MPDESLPDRIRMLAGAARIALDAESPARIARAVTPTMTRLAAENLRLALEVEPSSFTVVQRGEIGK